MAGAFLPPINVMLPSHRLKLPDLPIKRIVAHGFEQFGVDDHHRRPGFITPVMTAPSRVVRVTRLHLSLLTDQITERRVQCGARLRKFVRARYK